MYKRQTVWRLPAHVKALQATGIVGVRDALLDCLTFKLGEYNADIQHGPSHRGRGVELLRGRYKFHIVLLKQLHQRCKVQNLSLIHISDYRVLWEMMHRRWDIEENGFHQLKTYYHAKHLSLIHI